MKEHKKTIILIYKTQRLRSKLMLFLGRQKFESTCIQTDCITRVSNGCLQGISNFLTFIKRPYNINRIPIMFRFQNLSIVIVFLCYFNWISQIFSSGFSILDLFTLLPKYENMTVKIVSVLSCIYMLAQLCAVLMCSSLEQGQLPTSPLSLF